MCTTPNKKWIVAVWHSANKGKTATLRELANHLLQNYPTCVPIFPTPMIVPQMGDFRVIARINGRVVAVESQGDPHTDLHGRLLELTDTFSVDVIFCSTRTKGDTVAAVENLRLTRNFDTIWTSTYQTAGNHGLVNRMKAQHLVDLVRSLSIL